MAVLFKVWAADLAEGALPHISEPRPIPHTCTATHPHRPLHYPSLLDLSPYPAHQVGEHYSNPEAWECTMNTWNPKMAYCLTYTAFMEQLHAMHTASNTTTNTANIANLTLSRIPFSNWGRGDVLVVI